MNIKTEIHPKPPAPLASGPAEPSSYAMLYAIMQRTAFEMGYALAMIIGANHTMDVVAIPWKADAISNAELAEALLYEAGAKRHEAVMIRQPHGRRGWRVSLGGGNFIILSVFPRHGVGEI